MTATVTSPHDDVLLSVFGGGHTLVSVFSEVIRWSGEIPATQDYKINVVAVGGDTPYTLRVDIVGKGKPAPTPAPADTATPHPQPATEAATPVSSEKVIHITFDDGPTAPEWTPQVLDVLAEHNAQATFFVLGLNARRYPELIDAEYQANHVVANHTLDHRSLSGIGREAFLQEILVTQEILGDRGVRCLRPPYGATDSYTRARAAELGYRIVMWDIDTEDWRRPGPQVIADEVLDKAFPGAVVLMHDGGGDRSETIEALKAILDQLGDQGYRFEAICRE
jgi:peptidoglycan/xylan/chitin deacetylase (PgdA/CDA1 family)